MNTDPATTCQFTAASSEQGWGAFFMLLFELEDALDAARRTADRVFLCDVRLEVMAGEVGRVA